MEHAPCVHSCLLMHGLLLIVCLVPFLLIFCAHLSQTHYKEKDFPVLFSLQPFKVVCVLLLAAVMFVGSTTIYTAFRITTRKRPIVYRASPLNQANIQPCPLPFHKNSNNQQQKSTSNKEDPQCIISLINPESGSGLSLEEFDHTVKPVRDVIKVLRYSLNHQSLDVFKFLFTSLVHFHCILLCYVLFLFFAVSREAH